jgi:hypothetical protein
MLTHLLAAVMAAGITSDSFEASPSDELTLEHAARAYKIQVYNTFRLDRPEFNARRAEWDRLHEAWQTASKPTREIPKLIEWLDRAKTFSLPDSIEPLPEPPVIVADPRENLKNLSFWGHFFQHRNAAAATGGNNNSSDVTKTDISVGPANEPPALDDEPNSVKPATPVSSKAARDRSWLDEKKSSEPKVRPATPEPTDSSDAQPTKPAGGATWLHSLGQDFGEDLNSLAITLAWKRETR